MDSSIVFRQMTPMCAPSNTCFLGPPEYTSQTASRSVQILRFCTAHGNVPILQWTAPFPTKFPFAGGSGPHLIHGTLGSPSQHTKRNLDRFSGFAGNDRFRRLMIVTDRPTDLCYSVCNNRLHLRT